MRRISISDTKLAVDDQGQGAPLLFIHGFPLDHSMWSSQTNDFSESYRVIVPDLRGFGESSGQRELMTMAELSEDLNQLLDALEISEPVTLCGLSMGGYIIWQFLQRYPERVQRVILCDTKATADPEDVRQNRHQLATRVMHEGPDFFVEGMLEKLFAPLTFQRRPSVIEHTKNVILQTSPQTISAASLGMAERPDMSALLPKIQVPTLVICGIDDVITPCAEMKQLADMIPHGRFVEIPQAGHLAPLENPQAVNEIILTFLGETDV